MITSHNGQKAFSVSDAMAFGVNEAIFIWYLRDKLSSAYACRVNAAGKDRFELVIDSGQPWMPWTIEDFSKELPFWSEHQIRRIITSCKKQDLIQTGNYNQKPWDRRLWYTVKGMTVDD